jgi:hypothetical protein
MDFVAAGMAGVMNLFMLGLFIAGVMKLFQIHATLLEIKDDLHSGPHATASSSREPEAKRPAAPTPLHELPSGEEMLRALDAQMHLEEAARTPEVIERRS